MRLLITLASMAYIACISAQDLYPIMIAGLWEDQTLLNSTNSSGCPIAATTISISINDYSDDITVNPNNYAIENYKINSSMDPPMWQSPNQARALTYSIDPVTNQTTLIVRYSDSTSYPHYGGICFYSYQRNLTFFSGTWYLDFQSAENIEGTDFWPDSFTITNIDNLYMNVTYDKANSTPWTDYLYETSSSPLTYWTPTDKKTAPWQYSPTTDTFMGITYWDKPVYSRNGSYLSPEPFLGTWANPQYGENSIRSQCCTPYSIQLSQGSNYPGQLSALFYFNQSVLETSHCSIFNMYLDGDYVPINFKCSNTEFSSSSLLYANNDPDLRTFTLEVVDASDVSPYLLVEYTGGCNFTMTSGSIGPNPNSNPLSCKRVSSKVLYLAIVMLLLHIFI